MKYYIGIDGGGTKTQYALFDENKKMLCDIKTAGSNHENLDGGIPEAAGIIYGGITELVKTADKNITDISHVLMALAGIDHEFQRAAMETELKKLGLQVPFSIYNDGFIVIKAGAGGKEGIGYNCGTGTCCNSVDSNGALLQVGGFGELSNDVGGGHWIAKQTFTALYNDVCLGMGETSITKKAAEKFGISADRDGVLSLIPELEEEGDTIVRVLIDVFFEAVNEGDKVALGIVETMALRGAQFINAHFKKGVFTGDKTDIVLSGSIHTKLPSDVYKKRLSELTEQLSGRKCNFITLNVPPVTGCINWMLEDR